MKISHQFTHFIHLFLLLALLSTTINCSSPSLMPDKNDVEISRKEPSKDCKEMGKVRGTTLSTTGTAKEALADLHQEAANKGANYVVIKQYSDYQTSVTGIAYHCP